MKLLRIIDPDGVISRHKRSLKRRTYRTKVCVCVCVCVRVEECLMMYYYIYYVLIKITNANFYGTKICIICLGA